MSRDRAILTLGFSAALRRSELVALDVEDLVPDREGLRLMIRRSKTDQEGAGQEIAVPHGRHLRPVEAFRFAADALRWTKVNRASAATWRTETLRWKAK